MEGELTLLLMAVFFRWVAVSEREVSDEHRGRGGSGYDGKAPRFHAYTNPKLSGVGRT